MSKQAVMLVVMGSFNPPTIMHFRIMELARDFLTKGGGFHVVGGVVTPVHDGYKKAELAPGIHRVEMVNMALKNSWIKLSSWEALQNDNWTRTKAVVDYHQNRLNNYIRGELTEKDPWMPVEDLRAFGGVTCKLVCGADVLETFNTKGLWSEDDTLSLVRDYGLVVISREGNDPYSSIYKHDTLHDYRRNIHVVQEWLSNEISSTRIRRALRRSESVRYLVPDPVIEYIKTHNLYTKSRSSAEK